MRTYATYKDEGCALWFHKTSYMLHFLIPQDTTSISVQTHDTTILQSIFLFNSYYKLWAALQLFNKTKKRSTMKPLYDLWCTHSNKICYDLRYQVPPTLLTKSFFTYIKQLRTSKLQRVLCCCKTAMNATIKAYGYDTSYGVPSRYLVLVHSLFIPTKSYNKLCTQDSCKYMCCVIICCVPHTTMRPRFSTLLPPTYGSGLQNPMSLRSFVCNYAIFLWWVLQKHNSEYEFTKYEAFAIASMYCFYIQQFWQTEGHPIHPSINNARQYAI